MKDKIFLAILVIVLCIFSYAISPFMFYLNPHSGVWKYSVSVEHPVYEEIDVDVLKNDVRIERDIHGVPHIYAGDDLDLFFALGYVHAQDRLFQMDLQRRLPSGRLAELVGEAAYESDTFYRTLGMHRICQQTYDELSPWSREILDSYCDGINFFIETTDMFPLEYTLLQVEPEEWTPLDSIVFGKMMAWELSGNFNDLEMQKLEEAFGVAAVEELFPSQRPQEIPIIPGLSPACDQILLWGKKKNSFPATEGSNNWAIAPRKSETGQPMLCNDPHLLTTLPSLWYLVHMVSPSFDVTGVTFPGAPPVIIGRNKYIAWGMTNTGADVIDFYVETLSEDNTSYLYQGEWRDITTIEETIFIKGGEERTLTVMETHHGPILERDGARFAVQWTGLDVTLEFEGLLLINQAATYEEFLTGLRLFSVPAQNFVYADVNGTIAIRSTGKIPIRKTGTGRIPVDGASGAYEWTGYIPFEELPHAVNPPQGYLASANQIPVSHDYPYYLGFIWADRYRAERINTLLREKETLTTDDMMAIQSDTYDIPASIIIPFILRVVEPGTDREKTALEYLGTWNLYDERSQVAPTIFHTFLDHLKENIFHDEYGKAGIADSPYPQMETVETMLTSCPPSPFFDDVMTPEVETREDIISTSFSETVSELEGLFGSDVSTWLYGKKHVYRLEHLIGSVISALNYPEFGYDGSEYTIDVAGGWTTVHGPSWRQIIDFKKNFYIYPGGQVSNPFSIHYTDFVESWKESQYLPWTLEGYETESVLILRRAYHDAT